MMTLDIVKQDHVIEYLPTFLTFSFLKNAKSFTCTRNHTLEAQMKLEAQGTLAGGALSASSLSQDSGGSGGFNSKTIDSRDKHKREERPGLGLEKGGIGAPIIMHAGAFGASTMHQKSKRTGIAKEDYLGVQLGQGLGSKSVKHSYRKKRNLLAEQSQSAFGSGSIVKFGKKLSEFCQLDLEYGKMLAFLLLKFVNEQGNSQTSPRVALLSMYRDIFVATRDVEGARPLSHEAGIPEPIPAFKSKPLSGRTFERHQQSQKANRVAPAIGSAKDTTAERSHENRKNLNSRRPLHSSCLDGPLPVKLPGTRYDLTPEFFTRIFTSK